ncbi:MAG: helix-turn-helix domain-containing protein [Sciscionella sp.]
MPAENLRRLIERMAPGRSVRQLEEVAGAPQRLGYWLKPGTRVTRMPSAEQLQELARIIGCTLQEVYRAFRADVGMDMELADDLADDERRLLREYRRLSGPDQRKLHAILKILHTDDS